jgi:hypothetical protein
MHLCEIVTGVLFIVTAGENREFACQQAGARAINLDISLLMYLALYV